MSAEGPPSVHLHPHPIEVDKKLPGVQNAAGNALNAAQNILTTAHQRELAHTGNIPSSYFNPDGWTPLLEIAQTTALDARYFDPNSPIQQNDAAVVSYMDTVANRNASDAQVDWKKLGNPNYFPGTIIPPGRSPISHNIAVITKNLSDERGRRARAGDHVGASKIQAQIDSLGHVHTHPHFNPHAANDFFDAYTTYSNPNDPYVRDTKDSLDKNKKYLEQQTQAFQTLQQLGFKAEAPQVGVVQHPELEDATDRTQLYIQNFYNSGNADRAEEVRTRENLQDAINKLGNRNANTIRKMGSHALDIVRVMLGQGSLRKQHRKALSESYDLAHDKEAFLKEHHEVLVNHTNSRAKWTIDHGMPSWLLRGNKISKISRGLVVGIGVSALAAVFIGANPGAWVGIGFGAAAFMFDRKAHQKHRGKMKAGPDIDYSQGFNDAYSEMMRSYNRRLSKEYSLRFTASTLGALAAWNVRPKEDTGRDSVKKWYGGGQAMSLRNFLEQRGRARWEHDKGVIEMDDHGHH